MKVYLTKIQKKFDYIILNPLKENIIIPAKTQIAALFELTKIKGPLYSKKIYDVSKDGSNDVSNKILNTDATETMQSLLDLGIIQPKTHVSIGTPIENKPIINPFNENSPFRYKYFCNFAKMRRKINFTSNAIPNHSYICRSKANLNDTFYENSILEEIDFIDNFLAIRNTVDFYFKEILKANDYGGSTVDFLIKHS